MFADGPLTLIIICWATVIFAPSGQNWELHQALQELNRVCKIVENLSNVYLICDPVWSQKVLRILRFIVSCIYVYMGNFCVFIMKK